MGEVPYWYRVIKAAEQFSIGPWEFMDKPVGWIEMAEAARSAEAHAQEVQEKRSGRT